MHMQAWCQWDTYEVIRFHETGVTDNWEPPCRFLEVNVGFLKEQKVLLTTKPFIHPPENYCDDKYCSVLSYMSIDIIPHVLYVSYYPNQHSRDCSTTSNSSNTKSSFIHINSQKVPTIRLETQNVWALTAD